MYNKNKVKVAWTDSKFYRQLMDMFSEIRNKHKEESISQSLTDENLDF